MVVTLSPVVAVSQSQLATNEVLKAIEKSIMDLKTSVDKQLISIDKQLANLKTSVDQGNANI